MKIITYGFVINGKKSFIRNFWNQFDLIVFLVTFIGTIDAQTNFSGYNLKIYRALRIFRFIKYSDGL